MALALILAALAGQVTMMRPSAVGSGLAGFPRIAAPVTVATRRIDAAVARLDDRARAAARDCGSGSRNPTSWTRDVAITMRGPEFVSYAVTDAVDCGGAHPSEGHAAIVYDLTTGAPVDWAALLSPRLAGTRALTAGEDGARVVTLSSPRLRALYAARYDEAARAAGVPAECLGATADDGFVQPMLAWLDPRAGGLVLRFDLNHAMQACSVAVTIPVAILRREGASARMVRALTVAGRGMR